MEKTEEKNDNSSTMTVELICEKFHEMLFLRLCSLLCLEKKWRKKKNNDSSSTMTVELICEKFHEILFLRLCSLLSLNKQMGKTEKKMTAALL